MEKCKVFTLKQTIEIWSGGKREVLRRHHIKRKVGEGERLFLDPYYWFHAIDSFRIVSETLKSKQSLTLITSEIAFGRHRNFRFGSMTFKSERCLVVGSPLEIIEDAFSPLPLSTICRQRSQIDFELLVWRENLERENSFQLNFQSTMFGPSRLDYNHINTVASSSLFSLSFSLSLLFSLSFSLSLLHSFPPHLSLTGIINLDSIECPDPELFRQDTQSAFEQ